MNEAQWSAAIKAKANRRLDAIEVIYADTFDKKDDGKKASPSAVQAKNADETTTSIVTVLPPERPSADRGSNYNVSVAPPSINLALSPAAITVYPGDLTLTYILGRAAMYAFVFASGSMLGLLLAPTLMKHFTRIAGV